MLNYTIVSELSQVGNIQVSLAETEFIPIDIETNSLDPFTGKILLIQFKLNNQIYIIDVEKFGDKNTKYVLALLHCSGKKIIAHNSKFEMKFLYHYCDRLFDNVYDTMTAEEVITAGIGETYPRLEALVRKYCDVYLNKEIREQFITATEMTEELYKYSAMDVEYLLDIREQQLSEVDELKLNRVIDLEMKLLPVVAMMEYDGITLDTVKWMELHEITVKRAEEFRIAMMKDLRETLLKRLESSFPVRMRRKDKVITYLDEKEMFQPKNAYELFELCCIPVKTKKLRLVLEDIKIPIYIADIFLDNVNINSHLQLRAVLNNIYNFPDILEGTDKNVLAELSPHSDFPYLVSNFKIYMKRITSFGESFIDNVNPNTGRIHTNYNQVGTSTGRWASSNPNLQNIIKEEEYRNSFIAREGYMLGTADYSQAELRIAGWQAREQNIIRAYIEGIDIHTMTASLAYNVPIEEVTSEMRSKGKTLNFSILFGSSAFGIAHKNKDIDVEEAIELVDNFFVGYNNLATYIREVGKLVENNMFSKTALGRIRFFHIKQTTDVNEYRSALRKIKREGVNHTIQGTSADALKIAMVNMYYNNPFGHDKFRLLLQVHDEVVVEIHNSIVDEARDFIVKCMNDAQQAFIGDIPSVTNCTIKSCWTKE